MQRFVANANKLYFAALCKDYAPLPNKTDLWNAKVGLCAKIGVIIDVSRMRNKTSSQVRRKDS
jgi:microsomal dipeptidase-like Zn-dependent dipeptidase